MGLWETLFLKPLSNFNLHLHHPVILFFLLTFFQPFSVAQGHTLTNQFQQTEREKASESETSTYRPVTNWL